MDITGIRKNLTESENRELHKIAKDADRMFRRFWARVMNRQGYSNVEIAKRFGISESSVRRLLK